MNRTDALHLLDLETGADAEAARRTHASQAQDLDARIESAPTDVLRAKYREARAERDEALRLVLEGESDKVPGLSATQVRQRAPAMIPPDLEMGGRARKKRELGCRALYS